MANVISFNNSTILMIETNDGVQYTFKSAIDKDLFLKTHKDDTYELFDNYAICKRYLVVDTEGTGWVLTPKSGLPFEECANLIHQFS